MFQRRPSLLALSRVARRALMIFLGAHIVFLTLFAAPLVAQTRQEPTVLDPGKPIAREISGGQTQSYQIALMAGQFVSVTVQQRGIDLIIQALTADGTSIADFDREIGNDGEEKAEFVANAAGSYNLLVKAKYPGLPAGSYEISLVEVRPATAKDQRLHEARKQYTEAFQLVNEGKYDQAKSILETVLQVRESIEGPDHPDVGSTLRVMGNIGYYKGDFARAELYYQRAGAIFEKTLGPDNLQLAVTLNNLASLYQAKGDYPKSEQLHKRTLEIREKSLPQDHPDIAQSLNNLANIYKQKGDFENAVPLYQRALAINEKVLEPDHLNISYPLNNLADIYSETGEYDKAESLWLRSLSIREKRLGADHPSVAYVLQYLAENYQRRGDYEKAEAFYQRSLPIIEKKQGPDHPYVAIALNNLGEIYFDRHDYEKAEGFYQRSLAIRQSALGPDHPDTIKTLNNLALLHMAEGDPSQALVYKGRELAASERNIDLNLAVGSERQKLAYLSQLPEEMSQTISLHVRLAANDPAARELAATVLLQRKGRVQDALSNVLAALRTRSSADDQALIDRLNEATSQLARLALNGPQGTSPAEHQKRIKTLEEEREKLESEISRRSAGFYQQAQPVTLAAVRAAIPDDAALIELAVYRPFDPKTNGLSEPRYVAYVIRRQGEVQWKELGEAKLIDDKIDELRNALRSPRRQDVRELARAVDERIMRPIRPLIGDATHLLISADGALNLIPFEALVDDENRYLVERFAFTYLTSGRDLLRLRRARDSKTSPMVLANPLFGEPALIANDNASGPGSQRVSFSRKPSVTGKRQSVTSGSDLSQVYFAPLSGTAQEAQAIKSLFADASVLTEAQATESSLKRAAAPRLLHIATHGFFLRDSPAPASSLDGEKTRAISARAKIDNPLLRSGLALAGANLRGGAGDDDGILTAMEATGLNLWGTKLVVLSACDTGLGEVKNGEGVYGLRRAFVLAGAESLVMSLWPVSDYVARELMTDYYKGLKQGEGRGEALRRVQLAMLKRKGREHPFYWASFIQLGEWASLDGRR